MKCYVKTYDVSRTPVDPATRAWCRANNFSAGRASDGYTRHQRQVRVPWSAIREDFDEMLQNREGVLLLAHDGERKIGWGIAYDHGYGKYFQCYVLPRSRRKGVATKLLKRATQVFGPVAVFTHDDKTCEFFGRNGLTPQGRITGRRIKTKKKGGAR